MTSVPQVIRVICYLSKRAELSDEEFYNYWENKHAPLVAPWLVKHGVVGYEQVRKRVDIAFDYLAIRSI